MIIKKTLFMCVLFVANLFSQEFRVDKIEPPNWLEGMKYNKIQLMVYGEGLSNIKIESKSLQINKVQELENDNYIFIDVDLRNKEAGDNKIIFSKGTTKTSVDYPIYKRVI